jgi:outer membrane protein assembly factor BamB
MNEPVLETKTMAVVTSGTGRALIQLTCLGASFCVILCATMLLFRFGVRADDPLKSPQLAGLKEQLISRPKDETLKSRIRALDLDVRRRYFRELWLNRTGAWLMLAGAGVLLLAAKNARFGATALPMPGPRTGEDERWARAVNRARIAVAVVACTVGTGLMGTVLSARTLLPRDAGALERLLGASQLPVRMADCASLSEMQQNWPRFRGSGGNGISLQTNTPSTWNIRTGENIAWRTEIPAPGFNSPIVWGDRVYLSGADATRRDIFCFDGLTGHLLWRQGVVNAPGSPAQAPEVPDATGFAASSMATDGRRVYSIFANGDLAAWSLDGRQIWAKSLGLPKNPHGHATSLMTWEDRVVVQLDQGQAEQNASKLLALDGANGRVVWQRNRAMPASWTTPTAIDHAGRPQIVTLGVPWIIAYAPTDGTELWRVEGLSNEVTPSPIYAGGLVFAASPGDKLFAIRPDGQGNVTATHVAWSVEDNIPDITSPVSNGELVFTVSTPGVVTCFEVKDGKKVWEHDLGCECNSSPTLIGRRLLVISTKGVGFTIEAGRQFKEIAQNDLGENVYASPAFGKDRMFVRGVTNLYCITASATRLANK